MAAALVAVLLGGCAHGAAPAGPPAPAPAPGVVAHATAAEPAGPPPALHPLAPPQLAQQLGLMPLTSTGVAAWQAAHPTWDGRGVLIAILDSGADLGVLGLEATTTGARKVLDLRDLSGEGDVPLVPVHATGGVIVIDSSTALSGVATVSGLADDAEWYGGVLRELPFGDMPASDFNANGTNRDRYGIVVFKSGGRWIALIDTNGDGSLADEAPISDFLVRGETFTMSSRYVPRGHGPITGAVNLTEENGRPRLAIFLDTSGHGTHVSGIAAGHDMYGVAGFNGVAPGAQLIVIKIANNARGGVSTDGSMLRGMEYAARFAAERHLPMVLNMSFGIGNEREGGAVMDSIVDAFMLAHPELTFAIAAGNDGPGLSTVGLPGSAQFALTAGALYPGTFAQPQFGGPSEDVMGWWSSRGGELAKPDLVVPGIAYSTVPPWNTGDEIKLGTSMASPHLAGMAALLLSAAVQQHLDVRGADLVDALDASAVPLAGPRAVDQGWGVPQMEAAWHWLSAHHANDRFSIEALAPNDRMPGVAAGGAARDAAVAPVSRPARVTAFYRRDGLAPGDSVARFRVALLPRAGAPPGPRSFRLTSDAAWFQPVRDTAAIDPATGTALIDVRIDRGALRRPGRYAAAVTAAPAADSSAGPAFHLLGTVVVPDTATDRVLAQSGRKLAGGAVARTYVVVPPGAAALALRATVRGDTTTPADLFLFEPGGRPQRDGGEDPFGGRAGRQAALGADANDVVPGVYEVVALALPGHAVSYDLDVTVPAVRVAEVDSGPAPAIVLTSPVDTTLEVSAQQRGIATSWSALVDSGRIWSQSFAVPAWADSAVIEVSVDSQQWNDVTDFAVSLYDADGTRLGGDAMNYAFLRTGVALPEHRAAGYTAAVELFPAFARATPDARFPARVRLILLGRPHDLGAATPAHIPAAGSFRYAVPAFTPLAAPGWSDWLVVRAAASADDWVAVERGFEVPR